MKLPFKAYCGSKQVQNTCFKYVLSTLGHHLSRLSMKKKLLPWRHFQPNQDSETCDKDPNRSWRQIRICFHTSH